MKTTHPVLLKTAVAAVIAVGFVLPVSADEGPEQESTQASREGHKSHFSGHSHLRTSQRYNVTRISKNKKTAGTTKPRGIFPGLSRKKSPRTGPPVLNGTPKAASIRRIQNKGRIFGPR